MPFGDIPVLRRRFLLMLVVPVLAGAGGIVQFLLHPGWDAAALAVAIGFVCVGLGYGAFRAVRGRARGVLVRTRGLCCTRCGYSVLGLEDSGNCPECGHSFYAELCQKQWAQAAGFP